jgi:parallel beta-helix repeat protein
LVRERRLFTEGYWKMKSKAVSGIMLTLLLASMLTLAFNIQVLEANPIPVPPPWMLVEYIDAKISLADGVVQAGVDGKYFFIYFFPSPPYPLTDEVIMYYPIPPDADKITVETDETKLDWIYSNKTYPTVLGDWPMINWTVKPVPECFEIETYYEHLLPMIGGNYTFLYAMGTARYLDYGAKETTVYVSVSISKDVADSKSLIDVYTITEEGLWKSANHTIVQEDEAWIVKLTVVSEDFHPLEEDLLITIKSEPTTWTVDDDGPADFHTIQEAINAASPGDTIYVHNGTYYENVIVNKTVSLIGEDKYSTIIDAGSFGNVIGVTASNVKINSFTIQKSGIFYPFGCGIYVGEWSSGNNISCNIIALNSFGIRLFNSSSNIISENNIKANEHLGILLNSSKNNRIFRNDITNNDVGIALYESSNNSISGNNIANNRGGIWLDFDSSINIISGNNITNNWSGFWLGFGIGFMGSSHNFIYHNNFVNNYEGQVFTEASVNFWDDGYPSGGNYWSDYPDVDLLGGPFQNETGSDGIGDTSYTIDVYNRDNYPLMGMFSEFNVTSEHHVQTICNSSISDFQFNGTAICFNVTGETDTTGFCRICVPRALMNETYKVFVNGTEVQCNLLPCSNTTHSYLYFTYNHSTQEVIIIPEFPSFLILPLFMIATLLAVIVYRRKHSS